MFEKIIGNNKIKNQLINSIKLNKYSHSYLFLGKVGIGKNQIAREFAKMIQIIIRIFKKLCQMEIP